MKAAILHCYMEIKMLVIIGGGSFVHKGIVSAVSTVRFKAIVCVRYGTVLLNDRWLMFRGSVVVTKRQAPNAH
jgi:hypothetical protein